MRFRFHSHTHVANEVRDLIESEAATLDKRLAHVEEDLKLLDISFDHHVRDDSYTARLVLHVMSQSLPASATASRQSTAARSAFDELYKQLDVFIAKLKHEPEIRDEQRKPAWVPEPSLPID